MKTILHKKKVAIPLLCLAVLAIVVLVAFPFLPVLQSTIQKTAGSQGTIKKVLPSGLRQPDLGVPKTGNWLVIPAASLKMPINEGSDIAVLNDHVGVWHQTGDTLHNYVLAGHRLQYFRSVNQSLYHLDEVKPGDKGIYLVTNGVGHEYQATESKIVAPTAVDILNPTDKPRLTIYTCNDFYNHSRLVVTATPVAK